MIDRATLKTITPLRKAYWLYKYLLFRPQLAAAMFRDWRNRQDPSNGSIPPAKLRYRVHGSLDEESFLMVGRVLSENICNLLASVGWDIYTFKHVLDFGCGSGRVLRYFLNVPASCQLYGTDIDPEAIGWCERNMPGVQWSTNGYMPPTPFQDNTFDLIYAISVFTHLDEPLQGAWLGELQRIAKLGAILILTVHGQHVYRTLSPSEQDVIRSRGFLYTTGATGCLKLDGLPDFYQYAFHASEYIDREWSKYFEILCHLDRAINDHQDAVLLRKR
jgi:SAM-dependent methyltransferase